MKDALLNKIRQLIAEDQLEQALKELTGYADGLSGESVFINQISSISGQLVRINQDNASNLISYSDYIIKRNQIRSSLVQLMEDMKSDKPTLGSNLSNPTFQKSKITDMIFLSLIILLLVIGIGLFLYAALNSGEFEERIFQAGLSVTSISSSVWAYLRIRAINLLSN
jgi:hypothetical protein